MARERLYLFDTTLRDGAQTNGVDFTLDDKLAIADMLDGLGIDYVEGGYPGANPTDTQLFARERKLDTTFTAFGMTRRPGRSTSNDPGLAALLDAKADAICFVAKSWDYHVRVALETTPEENLASIRDSVRAAKAKGREVLLDCEHFFDGYKANPKLRARLRQGRLRRGRALGRAVRHQRRHAAARGGSRSSARSSRSSPAIMSASTPITTPSRRWRIRSPPCAPARARSRARSTGSASAAATPTSCRSSRRSSSSREFADKFEIGVSDDAAQDARARLAHARRDAQPRAQPPRALRGRERVRHQGRHPRLRDHEGAGDLRARAARDRRQPAQAPGVGPGRQVERAGRARPHRASRSTRTMPASGGCSTWSRSARRSATPTRRRTPRSSCLARRMLGKVPNYFDVEQFDVNVEQRVNAMGERVTVSHGGGQGEGRRRDV